MESAAPDFAPHTVESEVAAFWKARRLPPGGGVLGPPGGPTVRQFVGSWTPGDFPALVAQRAVVADVDARYFALAGRRAGGTLRQWSGSASAPPSTVPALLTALGVWTGGDGRSPWDAEDRAAGVQKIVGRLAWREVLVTRDESFRICPVCGTLRCPERLIYDEREGDTYLVRFPVRVGSWTVNALVWVDSPWKLLGTSALLLNPTMKYVVAGYHRRNDRELVLTSTASLDRIRSWITECTLEVVEERTGREFQGIAYTYPLRHEFPMGGDLAPPAGTILAAADVGNSGTGIVPLVPGHGPTDSHIADRLGVTGWPLLTPKGRLDYTLMHKYAGLDLETANEFVLRDLSEAGALFARLRVKRGVPFCSICGSPLLWAPARAWCLEPSRLPAERRATFSRLLPKDVLPGQAEVAPWPVSEGGSSDEDGSVALLECTRCDRLDAPDGPKQCPCGGQRTLVRRRLLPSFETVAAAWARYDPFPDGDSAHLYVGHRRRVPSVVHHLAALSAVEGSAPEVALTIVPTAAAVDLPELVGEHGADVVRAVLVRSGFSESSGGRFSDQCEREADRLRRWWALSKEVISLCDPAMIAAFSRPIGGFLGELEVEDRAIVARWERTRVLALAHYDHSAPALVHRRVARFVDNDLAQYRELIQPRLSAPGTPPTKSAALRTLVHLLRGIAEVLAPISPFTSEAVHRSLSTERTSLFEQPMVSLDRSLVNDDLVAAWDRWHTVLRSLDRFRRSVGIPRSTPIPSVVLVVSADDVGDRLRAEKDLLARLGRVQRLEVGSPKDPWKGRQRVLRPIDSEIQKVYPAQASQIAHILNRMGPRRSTTAAGGEELSVVIDGYPVRVFSSMVAYVETLPKMMVPVRWPLGEMYAERLQEHGGGRAPIPPLSPDAFWLVRRLERRLRSAPPSPDEPARVAVATVKDPLASELRVVAEPLARYLGLTELRVVEKSEEAIPPAAIMGRTRTGDRWWIHVPGLPPVRIRQKRPVPSARFRRVALFETPAAEEEVDYADEKLIAHEQEIRVLGQALDDVVGLPLLGPSKISAAWDSGVHSLDDLRNTPFDVVAALPGFGGPVAEVVVAKLGGTVPPPEARPRRPRTPLVSPRPSTAAPPPIAVRAAPVPPPTSTPRTEPAAPGGTAVTPSGLIPPSVPAVPEEPAVGKAETEALPELVPEPALPAALPEPAEESVPPPTVSAPVSEPVPAPELSTPEVTVELPPPPEESPTVPTEPPIVVELPSPEQELVRGPELEEKPPLSTEPAATTPTIPPPPLEPVAEAPTVEETSLPAEAQAGAVVPGEGEEAVQTQSESAPSEETVMVPPEPVLAPAPEPSPEMAPTATETGPSPPEAEQSALPPEEYLPTETPEAPVETSPVETPSPPETAPTAEAAEPSLAPQVLEVPPPTPEAEPTPSAEPGPSEVPAPSEVAEPVPSAAERAPVAELAPAPVLLETPPAPEPPPTAPSPAEPEAHPPPVTPLVAPPVAIPAPALIPKPEIPTPAVAPPPEPVPPPPPSGVELSVGEPLVVALAGFLDSTAAGHRGVCLVRESPERIRARVGPRPIDVYWLSNIGRGPSLRPSDLEGVWNLLSRKLVEERATAFFIEGIEYLVRIHGADAVLSGLVQFDRLARENDARVWVFLTPVLMKPTDLDRFQATFGGASTG